jgi:hypothetical protein
VKTLRVCLLLLLALVLPLRGALAQALPCSAGHAMAVEGAPAAAPDAVAVADHGHHHGHAGAHAVAKPQAKATAFPAAVQAREAATALHGSQAAEGPGDPSPLTSGQPHGQCSACASCCLGAPLADARVTALPALPADGAMKFPGEALPVASVVLDGLERPPRSL